MTVFIGILDWGLGHATRCMPIIRSLLQKGIKVIIGGEGRSLILLQHTFQDLVCIELPPYNIRYSTSSFQIPILLAQVPRLLSVFREEHRFLEELIERYQIDAVISDNGYGLWTKKVQTVYITHQIAPLAPFRYLVYLLQKRFIAKFDEFWIPDFSLENQALAGSLAHKYPLPPNSYFIGTLSRFSHFHPKAISEELLGLMTQKVEIVTILSGPEPQRSILSQKIREQSSQLSEKVWIIEGKTEEKTIHQVGNIITVSFLTENELWHLFQHQPILISRGGYSSLMDFSAVGLQKCILIPTPGQTEQVYLAQHLARQGKVIYVKQKDFVLKELLNQLMALKGFDKEPKNDLLEKEIKRWLSFF